MTPPSTRSSPQFDTVAKSYDEQLNNGLRFSGEGKEYFAEQRVKFLRNKLPNASVLSILDYGCGTGGTSRLLAEAFPDASVLGVDVSEESLHVARSVPSDRVRFCGMAELTTQGSFDLVYCNGVFHHILPQDRAAALSVIRSVTRISGCFSFWENNPWNPGTRLIMSRIPFDRDAIPLSAIEARRRLRDAGFAAPRAEFHFIFPKALALLRPLEEALSGLPLGGQYHVFCRAEDTSR